MSFDKILAAVQAAAKTRKEPTETDSTPTVGEVFEQKRKELDLTMREFAVVVGLSPYHYNELIAGKRPLTLRSAKRAYAIGVPADVLLG